jgi:ATP/maltotriose-dependent transcriptional regulator MalT
MAEYRFEYPRVKLYRPHAIAGSIERPRLMEKLDQVLQKPVALISAPTGFGKTTLLAQWLERCPLPNAWLQLDENDQEIPTFLSGVVARAAPGPAGRVYPHVCHPGSGNARTPPGAFSAAQE